MLTSEQKFFIETLDKPLILSSNFGCSKTTLILNKLKFLIKEKKISKHRIFHTNGQNKSLIDLGENLIHEYSLQIPNFYKHSIFLDELNSKIYFLKNIDKFEIKSTNKKNKETQIANDLYYSIKSIKENGYELKDLDKLKFTDLNSKLDIFSVFLKYEQFKQKNHLYDESDILLMLKTLLNKNETIRKEIQSKFDYFLIDDFEKISKVEFELL